MNYWGLFFIGACILILATCFFLIWRDERRAEERERRAVEEMRRLAEDKDIIFLAEHRRRKASGTRG